MRNILIIMFSVSVIFIFDFQIKIHTLLLNKDWDLYSYFNVLYFYLLVIMLIGFISPILINWYKLKVNKK